MLTILVYSSTVILFCFLNYILVKIVLNNYFFFFTVAFHEVSVYPKKELPFFILFTAGLCSFTALLALLTHQYPEPMGTFAKNVSFNLFASLFYIHFVTQCVSKV